MHKNFINILDNDGFDLQKIVLLINSEGNEKELLFEKARTIKKQYVYNIVYFRGLIEFSNSCLKNCNYCGIRSGNKEINRFNLSDKEIIEAARYAYENNYGSVVLQSGETETVEFTERISRLLKEIKSMSDNKLGITLSVGEQHEDVYKKWFDSGAHRYLLRIETSNETLYKKIHPQDGKHLFKMRLKCLESLKKAGYQTGSGVMIGLPFQTIEDLANDLLFMKSFDIDMAGMGPYIEHARTPLLEFKNQLLPLQTRFDLTLKMIAILRIMMKDINIAAGTALQVIDPIGREKAIKIGANIIMPNITPGHYRDDYKLYDNKPGISEEADDCKNYLELKIGLTGNKIGYGEWGDSKHYFRRVKK
jgi:biotin synthase